MDIAKGNMALIVVAAKIVGQTPACCFICWGVEKIER